MTKKGEECQGDEREEKKKGTKKEELQNPSFLWYTNCEPRQGSR